MTNQEAFDKIYTHLLTQKKRSVRGDSICAYRGRKGLMCAVGCLIRDSEYDEGMENVSVEYLVLGHDSSNIRKFTPPASIANLDVALLKVCQEVHDDFRPSRWPAKLRKVATRFGLTVPEVNR